MAGVVVACISILVMTLIAGFVAIVSVIATVSGYGKPTENDEE